MIGRVMLKRALVLEGNFQNKVPVRTMYPHQSSNVVAGMPRNRIPFLEKIAAGIFMGTCVLAIPVWIVTHMDNYRTLSKPED